MVIDDLEESGRGLEFCFKPYAILFTSMLIRKCNVAWMAPFLQK